MSNSCQQTCVFKFKIVFLRGKENVPPAIKQYKNRGNASNLAQSHFGSPQLKRLESGIAPLVPRSFDPACWGLYQPSPSGEGADDDFSTPARPVVRIRVASGTWLQTHVFGSARGLKRARVNGETTSGSRCHHMTPYNVQNLRSYRYF